MIGVIIGTDEYPETCKDCPLFISNFGHAAYCSMGGEYSEKEIKAEKDGALNMYYYGCLKNRPKNCPLKEVYL